MGISPKKFLDRYFTSAELKEPLDDIGFPVGGIKKERIERIVENWTSHHRTWYDLLEFLDWGKLSKVCDDFGVSYSEYNTEDTLCNKIEDGQVIDSNRNLFQTKTLLSQNPPKVEKQSTKKINPHVIFTLIGWMVIGIIFAMLNFSGIFIEIHDEEMDISKKYQVSSQSWKDENTLSGILSGISLKGKILFQSTQFSSQNKIDVHIELSPNTDSSVKDIMMLDSIVSPLNVYFIGAQHVDIENDKPLVDILLHRSSDRTKLIGEDSIIYSKGGNHDIYLLDSTEIGLKQDLLTVNESNNAVVLFLQQEKTLNPNGYFDENGNQLTPPAAVEFISTTEPYVIEIKQSDAQNSLGSDKMNAFAIWITLAFAPYTIIPALKYLPTNKL